MQRNLGGFAGKASLHRQALARLFLFHKNYYPELTISEANFACQRTNNL